MKFRKVWVMEAIDGGHRTSDCTRLETCSGRGRKQREALEY